MAGYNGYSKSNNAIDAEKRGLFPASRLARELGVKTAAIQALIDAEEWHHTSKKYNETNYYNGSCLRAVAAGDEAAFVQSTYGRFHADCDYHTLEDARQLLADLRAWRKPVATCWVCGAPEHTAGEICPEVLKARAANRNDR